MPKTVSWYNKQKLDEQLKNSKITKMFSFPGPIIVESSVDKTCGKSINYNNFDELFSNVSDSSFVHESEEFSLPHLRFTTMHYGIFIPVYRYYNAIGLAIEKIVADRSKE